MKNQFRYLQSVVFILLIGQGMSAFTRPSGNDPIGYDIMEGKIEAGIQNAKALYTYETELMTTHFTLLTPAQQFTFFSRLKGLKTEFYLILQKTK